MIRSFRHKGLETFFQTGKTSGIQAKHAKRLQLRLGRLNRSSNPNDMAVPGWKLHELKGESAERWAIWVDARWRLTFAFENGDAVNVDYEQYH